MGLFDSPQSGYSPGFLIPAHDVTDIYGSEGWQPTGLNRDYEKMLRARAQGLAPSAAERQLQMGLERQIAAGQSAAAGAIGIAPGLAQRLAGQQRSQAMAATNQQAGFLRAHEQAQAQGMLGNLLEARRQEYQQVQQRQAQMQMLYAQLMMQQDMANAGARGAFQNNLIGGLFNAGGALMGGLL